MAKSRLKPMLPRGGRHGGGPYFPRLPGARTVRKGLLGGRSEDASLRSPKSVRSALKITQFFFDRPDIIRRIDKNRRRALMKAGAYIRSDARQSIRVRKNRRNTSPAGAPPYSHDIPRHRFKWIFFSWDTIRETMVVGPVHLRTIQGTTVPEVHEKGGGYRKRLRTFPSSRKQISSKQRQAFLAKFGHKQYQRKTPRVRSDPQAKYLNFPKRPYMDPAYQKNKRKIRSIMRDAMLRT